MSNVIQFPGRKRIIPDEFRITDDNRANVQFKEQTLEEIEDEIALQVLDDAIRLVLREEGLIE